MFLLINYIYFQFVWFGTFWVLQGFVLRLMADMYACTSYKDVHVHMVMYLINMFGCFCTIVVQVHYHQ